LFAALYGELHRMAQRELARHGAVTLSATTLVHEAYLDIAGRQRAVFADRRSFMVYASRVMRGLIIDYARGRLRQKRGAQFEFVPVTADLVDALPDRTDLTRISDALDALTTVDPRLAVVVDLKFFCGFSLIEIAGCRASQSGRCSAIGRRRASTCAWRWRAPTRPPDASARRAAPRSKGMTDDGSRP
jgi:RNA polymerase sigma factor (TIGR02999 family)